MDYYAVLECLADEPAKSDTPDQPLTETEREQLERIIRAIPRVACKPA